MKAVVFLNSLVEAIPLLEILAKQSKTGIDDWLVDLAKQLQDNDELLEELAYWLSLLPGFEAKALPSRLQGFSDHLYDLREAYHDKNKQGD
jgi:hypothetical protein